MATLSGDVQGIVLDVNDQETTQSFSLTPNPSTDFIEVTGLIETENYKIYDALGSNVANGTIAENEKIDIQNLQNGIYFLILENGNSLKFIKE